MWRISVAICLAGLLACFKVDAAPPALDCASQYKDHLGCLMDIEATNEVTQVIEKKKEIFRGACTGYPEACTNEWGTMLKCAGETVNKAKDDAELKTQMDKTGDAINKCFDGPNYPYGDLDMVFAPPFLKAMMSTPLKMNKSDDDDGESQWPLPRPDQLFRKECQPKPEHMQCLTKQMGLALRTPAFRQTIAILLGKIGECGMKVKFECRPNSPDQKRCFFAAHKDVFKIMFDRVSKCTKQKLGAAGPAPGPAPVAPAPAPPPAAPAPTPAPAPAPVKAPPKSAGK